MDASATRHNQIVAATRWCALSVVWALLVAVTSLAAGLAANFHGANRVRPQLAR